MVVLLHRWGEGVCLLDHEVAILLQGLPLDGQAVLGLGPVPLLMLGNLISLVFIANRLLEQGVV